MNAHNRHADRERAESRLTAYALGQLEGAEKAAAEAEVHSSEAARRRVESVRALAGPLCEAGRAPSVTPSAALRAAVETRLNELKSRPADQDNLAWHSRLTDAVRRRPWQNLAVIAAAACLLIGVFSLFSARQGVRRASETTNVVAQRQQDPIVPLPLPARAVASTPRPNVSPPPVASKALAGSPATPIKPQPSSSLAMKADAGNRTASARSVKAVVPDVAPPPAPVTAPPLVAKSEKPTVPTLGAPVVILSSPSEETPAVKRARSSPVYMAMQPIEFPRKEPTEKRTESSGPAVPRHPPGFGEAEASSTSGNRDAARKLEAAKLLSADEPRLTHPLGMPSDVRKPWLPKGVKRNVKPLPAVASPKAPVVAAPSVENPFVAVAKYPRSRFSLVVEPDSYITVDRSLRAGTFPRPDRTQIEELVNYFAYDYREPIGDSPLAVSTEAAQCPWNPEHRLVRVAVIAGAKESGEKSLPEASGQPSSRSAVIAKDVQIEIEFLSTMVSEYRLIGYDAPSEDSGHGGRIAFDIRAGHAVTAFYEVIPVRAVERAKPATTLPKFPRKPQRDVTAADHPDATLTVLLRYRPPKSERYQFVSHSFLDSGQPFAAASADFRFAAAVASFGMILRESSYAGAMTLQAVEEIASAARGSDPDKSRAGFLELVAKARQLKGDR